MHIIFISNIISIIKVFFEDALRAFSYGFFGFKTKDWDYAYLYDLLEFKLKRMKKEIYENPIHQVGKKELQSLNICLKLLKRLKENDYAKHSKKAHNKKWGSLIVKNDSYNGLTFIRPNVQTNEQKEQERKEQKEIWVLEDGLRNRDRKLLFNIMNMYLEYWWS